MGKNNNRKSRTASTPSISGTKEIKTNRINSHKTKKLNNKNKRKSRKKIQQLFENLRNKTEYSRSMSFESNSNDTVIEVTENNMSSSHTITPVKNHTSLIIINDDDDLILKPCNDPLTPKSDLNSSPIHCSTPIAHRELCIHTKSSFINNDNLNNNNNSTKEINKDSYLTIDLTTETMNITNLNESQITVIDLVNNTNTKEGDLNSLSSSMSGDSQVTVLQNKKSKINRKQMEKFVSGIAKLSSTDRGKLLEVIAQKILNHTDSSSRVSVKSRRNCSTETAEDAFIKEVILGQAPSRNSIGSNIYNPQRDIKNRSGLRMIVIDGSNVAMQHSNGRVFSVSGLKICIEYFLQRGHIVKAFVPQFRCKLGMSTDGKSLDQLERQGLVVYTPSRMIQGRQISSYDDRYIVQCAAEFDGVIVSRDNYRDLLQENPRWRPVIENRLLQFTWVGDLIMFPRDPLGRNGPTLEEFLRHPTVVQHPTVL